MTSEALEKTAAMLTYGVHRSIDQHDDPATRRALALLIARNLIDAAATTELPPPRDKIILDGLLDHEPGCRAPDYGPCTCTAETQERLRAARENKP